MTCLKSLIFILPLLYTLVDYFLLGAGQSPFRVPFFKLVNSASRGRFKNRNMDRDQAFFGGTQTVSVILKKKNIFFEGFEAKKGTGSGSGTLAFPL